MYICVDKSFDIPDADAVADADWNGSEHTFFSFRWLRYIEWHLPYEENFL